MKEEKCRAHTPPAKPQGLTLLELLVAMAVFSLLLLALFSILENSTQLWRNQENRVDSYREARSALHTITQELRSLYPSTNSHFFSTEFTHPIPENIEGSPLFFLSKLPASAQGPAVSVEIASLGYYLAYQKHSASADNASLNLHRYFRNGDQTFSKLTNIGATIFSDWNPKEDEILARNITHFEVIPLYTTATGITRTPPTSPPPYPPLLEIRLHALNSDVARRLSAASDWPVLGRESSAKQAVREFVVRVHLSPPPHTP